MYCTIDDIIGILGTKVATQLSDDDNFSVNEEYIELKITEASEIIDSFLASVYELPLVASHAIIKLICLDLVKYFLLSKYGISQDDEKIQVIYDKSMKRLEDISNKKIKLIGETELTLYYSKNSAAAVYDPDILDYLGNA